MGHFVVRTTIIGLVLFGAIQVVRPSRTNPAVEPGRTIQAVVAPHPSGPVIARACGDCHSHETTWPWYSEVAPASWLISHDVAEARTAVNFSEWSRYPPEQQQKLLRKSCEELRTREMPPPMYIWLHRSARLTSDDVRAVCDLAQSD